jgi:hypothetical protein
MNKPVSFPIAKLLKEKKFDVLSSNFYTNPRCKMFGIDEHGRYYPIKNKAKNLWISGNAATLDSKHVYYAPTVSDLVMWLYEKYGIWISPTHQHNQFFWGFGSYQTQEFKTPTEAYESAIIYTLNNLI